MAIYAIADLHLSFSEDIEKPMGIFGGEWVNHAENVKKNWEELISEEDTVIVAGDISWALKLDEAIIDLNWIRVLPGKKVFIKGNHDHWWSGINKLDKLYDEDMCFLQNNFYEADGYAICGSRGWNCPGSEAFTEHDEKIYKRELLRLRFSLEAAKAAGFAEIIGVLHFPPTNDSLQSSGFTRLFEEFDVKQVFFGHLHGKDGFKKALQGNLNGVEYRLVSLDYLKSRPLRMGE